MPHGDQIARRADEERSKLDQMIESGSMEQKRELIRSYVGGIKSDPARQEVEISHVPALFSQIATGAVP